VVNFAAGDLKIGCVIIIAALIQHIVTRYSTAGLMTCIVLYQSGVAGGCSE